MFKVLMSFLLWFLAIILASTIYGFASSDTGGIKPGGEGLNQISGWVVSNVKYTLADDPSKLNAVEFDLDSQARTVQVGFLTANPQYFPCTNETGNHWLCEINRGIDILNIEGLRVIATGG